jgi:TolB-like protein
MNKAKKIPVILLIVCVMIASCASAGRAGSPKQLDKAIKEASELINGRLQTGTKIVFLSFNSPSGRFNDYVFNKLEDEIFAVGNLLIIDRKNLEELRGELKFQTSGEVSDRSMQAVGQMLGAQYVVSGNLTDLSGSYRIGFRVLGVQTATVAAHYRADITNDSRVRALLAARN